MLHGRVSFPDLTNIFLLGSLKANDNSGVAIYFKDVAEFWCSLLPSGIPCIDPEVFGDAGLLDTSIYFSGRGGVLLGKHYPAGFAFESGIKIWGIKLKLRCAMTMVHVGWAVVPNFAFDFYLNLEEFYPLVEAKLKSVTLDVLQDPSDLSPTQWWKVLLLNAFNFSRNFFQLNEVALLGLDFMKLAKGGTLLLRIDFDFWGINTVFEIRLSVMDLYKKTFGAILDVFKNAKAHAVFTARLPL